VDFAKQDDFLFTDYNQISMKMSDPYPFFLKDS